MAWRGSLSRSLVSTARASTFRSSPLPLPRLRPPSVFDRLQRRLSFTNPRMLGELGCVQSVMPLHSVVAGASLTSHLAVNLRGCCELSHGIFCRTCQDRCLNRFSGQLCRSSNIGGVCSLCGNFFWKGNFS